MATNAAPPAGVPPRKKTSPWVWVIAIVLGLFLLAGVAATVTVYYFYGKVRQYAATAEKNPAYAAAKLIVDLNPDLEMVSTDERRGVMTIREKKTGKTVTLNFEDIRKGKISFQEEGQGAVTFQAQGEGDKGTLEVKSAEGTARFGAGASADIPAWFPAYPGSTAAGAFVSRTADKETGTFSFKTKDPIDTVVKFYEAEFQKLGMKVQKNMFSANDKTAGGMITAEDGKRKVMLNLGASEGSTEAMVTFEAAK